MHQRFIAVSALALAVLVTTFSPASAEKRVALVIGNAAYQHVPPLANPSNDATDMAAKLRGLGFVVIEGTDLAKRDMEKRIRAYAEALAGADVGLFYYAGHGLQVDQKNYLAPVDAELRSESDLDFEAVELDLVLKHMVRNAATSIVFLDACRDNPLAQTLAQASRSLAVGRGLARVDAAASMMVVYSTEPGNVALDGTGRNSPFTEALLRHIDSEGESIGDVMIEVRNDVLKATGGKQRPFESASLTGQFFFKPGTQPAASANTSETELAALKEQIARLQADQGALLKSQQEQLEALQKKLAEESKPGAAEANSAERQIAVEPAVSSSAATPAEPPPGTAKVAAADSTGASPTATQPTASPPVPETATSDQLATDMLGELKKLGCYFGDTNRGWGERSQLALARFNRLSSLDLPIGEPAQSSLDALRNWKGAHCPVEKAVAPRAKSVRQSPPTAAPRKQLRAAAPKARPVPSPRKSVAPPSHRAGGGDEQRELQRAFPSAAWPGQ